MKHICFTRAVTALSAILLAGGTVALAAAQAGTPSDPLITRSYAEGTYRDTVTASAEAAAKKQMSAAETAVAASLAAVQEKGNAAEEELARQAAAAMGVAASVKTAGISAGGTLTAPLGTEICLISGAADLASGNLINLTTGQTVPVGGALTRNQLYLTAEGGAVLRASSAARVRVSGAYTVAAGTNTGDYTAQYTAYADALHELGLFSGTGSGYELERTSTRAEGLVMLLRLLGKEKEAAAYTGSHPFTDVPEWAARYVAYAYHAGYTSGMSEKQYGSQRSMSLNDYMTFLLRALGYQDTNGDFSWKTAADTAVRTGILTEAHRQQITARGTLYRDDIVYASYQALFAQKKGGAQRLCDQLIEQGVFAQVDLDNAAELTR